MLTCNCLNIIINTSNLSKIEKFQLTDHQNLSISSDEFFQKELGRVTLESITKVQPSLVHSRNVGNWIIHECWNCGLLTHALQKEQGASNVIVNLNMMSNDNEISALRQKVSKVFNIVINNITSELLTPPPQNVLSLQQKLQEAVRLETQATEFRIRQFTENEYEKLDQFRQRGREELNALTNIVVSRGGIRGGRGNDDSGDISNNIELVKPKIITVATTTPPVTIPKSRSQLKFIDSDTLFDLDGIDDDFTNRIGNSDTESDDSDITDVTNSLAKSLPMNVPTFMTTTSRNFDDDQQMPPPQDIAASIKALARSVHGDYVFGDLPKPRFSSQM